MSIEDDVKAFHEKHAFPINQRLISGGTLYTDVIKDGAYALKLLSVRLKTLALQAQEEHADPRLYRWYLLVEELAEVGEALANCDRKALAHELGDLRYVAAGTDVTYGIPSSKIDAEIHKANMTRAPRTSTDPRMRDKGPNYVKPNIEGVLNEGH